MIFVDSSFWIALRSRREAHHDEALAILGRLPHANLLTTNHVTGETWTFLRKKAGHASAVHFLDSLERAKRLTQVFVTKDSEKAAWRWLRRHDERVYSFVDATSFVTMKANKIREALAFDGDFSAAGFIELRA